MDVICRPGPLRGSLPAIPSKSDAHRLLICAALADRPTVISMPGWQGEDIDATLRCLRALGASFEDRDGSLLVRPITASPRNPLLDCGESGSTLRFLLPVAAALGRGGRFIGSGRLPQRPIGPLLDALKSGGVSSDSDALPLTLSGRLASEVYTLPGDVSSQFVSGFLFALPLLEGGGSIRLLHRLESAGYVEMTRSALRRFGVEAEPAKHGFLVPPGQSYRSPGQTAAEGDWSNMAFFLTAGVLGGPVGCTGLSLPSLQGDSALAGLLKDFGAEVAVEESGIRVQAGPHPQSLEIDVRAIPDLVPILAVLAAFRPGTTRFVGAARLRLKESDRIATTARMIRALGGSAREEPDALIIQGGIPLRGGTVEGCGDHRIIMAGAIAATLCQEETILEGAEAANKSYPSFFEDYQKLGGNCHVIYHG